MKIREKLRRTWQFLRACYYEQFGYDYVCGCGHPAKHETIIEVEGRRGVYTASDNTPYCPACWMKAMIQCAWCGKSILPGDAITLYTPKEEFKIPDYAVVYRREPHLQLVGCLRMDCTDGGMDRAGFWVMPGKVQRALSPLEQLLIRGGDEPLIVSDLSDPGEAILIRE